MVCHSHSLSSAVTHEAVIRPILKSGNSEQRCLGGQRLLSLTTALEPTQWKERTDIDRSVHVSPPTHRAPDT